MRTINLNDVIQNTTTEAQQKQVKYCASKMIYIGFDSQLKKPLYQDLRSEQHYYKINNHFINMSLYEQTIREQNNI